MATEVATAYVTLLPRMKGTSAAIAGELGAVPKQADVAGKKAGRRMGASIAGGLKRVVGPALAAITVGATFKFAKDAVDSFGELEDATGAASVVFGKGMGKITKMSDNAASTMGLSKSQAIDAANTFGTFGKSAGKSGDDLAGFAVNMTKTAADLASFKGTSPEQAIEAVGAALRGETEPIRQYGVLLDDATLKNRAMAMGIYEGTGALTPQQKVLAAQQEILAQTTDAQGDFQRTASSTANTQKRLQASSENLKAAIGEQLAPAFTKVREVGLRASEGFQIFLKEWDKGVGTGGRVKDALKQVWDMIQAGGTIIKNNIKLIGSLVGAWAGYKAVKGTIRGVNAVIGKGKAVIGGIKGAWGKATGAAKKAGAVMRGAAIGTRIQLMALKVQTLAHAAAQKVALVATKAWSVALKVAAVAQRMFNAAMKANPIGLIITAITLLVAALVWFFTKTKVGKKIVAAAWKGIKVAIKAVADWWTKTAWPAMKKVIDAFGKAFRVAGKIIKIAWNGIKAVMSKVWNWIKKNVLDKFKSGLDSLREKFSAVKKKIGGIWSGLGDKLKAVWAWIQAKVFGKFKGGLDSLREKFANIKKKIGEIWDGLKQKLKDVWEWIRDKVFGKFKGGLDSLREKFSAVKKKIGGIWDGLKQKLADVWVWIKKHVFGPLKDGLKSVKEAFRKQKDGIAVIWNKLKGIAAKPVNFVIGTVYNNGIRKLVNKVFGFLGMNKRLGKLSKVSWDTGGYTGRGGKYDPAGVVHRDEFVVRSASRRTFERQNPGALDYLNTYGSLPGYASGGTVAMLKKGLRWWQAKGARVGEFAPWGPVAPVHMKGSLHYSGQAGDLNYGPGGQNATEMAFFDKWLPAFRGAFPMLNALWRVPGHYNHLHLDTGAHGISSSGGGAGGGGFDFFGVIDKLKALKNKLTGALFDNPIGQFVAKLAKKVIGAPVDWIKEKAGAAVGGVKDAGVSAVVKAVAMKYGSGLSRWGMGAQWDAIAHIIDKESGWDPHAANPTSSARGLFQKMTSIHGPIEKSIAGQATWGLNYIKSRYGTPVDAWNHWKKNHSYDQGGWLPAGGIGINQTGKPEAVLTPAQSEGLTHLGEPVDLSRETVLELADAILAGATAVASRETARAARARGSAMRAGVRR